MSKTIIIYTDHLRYELQLTEDKKVLLAASEKAQLYLPYQETPIQLQLAEGQVFYQMGEETGVVTDGLTLGNLTLYQSDSEPAVYDLLDRKELLISDQKGADISLEAPLELLLKRTNDSWLLTKMRGQVYLNHVEWTGDQIQLEAGDELSLEGICLKVYPEEIWVTGPATVSSNLTLRGASRHGFYPDYPDYHRSPRIIYRSSEDKIQIAPPSKEPQKPNDELLRLIVPPLLMVGVTVLITLVQPRGIYILVTVTMSIASAIFSVRGFFKNRKKFKEDKKERIDLYHLYLKDKAIELNKLEREQRDGMLYHFPNINELTGLVTDYSHRIYEKTPLHFDFLYYRLGLGQVPTSYKLTYGQEERSGKKDALEEEGYALYTRHKKIPDLPIVANLSHGPVGYIGPRNLVLEQLQLLVMQLAVFHSYHDVQVITIMPEEERDQWDWLRWLPHATLQELNVRGFVYNQRTHDQVLNSLNQILKLRKAQKEEATRQETTLYSPHYVVLVTDEKLILDHIIMEFFTEDPTDLGCSLIFVQDVMSSLSENIKTVVNIKDRNTGQLVMEEGILREIDFRLDHFPEGYDKERIARTLAPLNHLQNLKSSIPDTVTFMEMYGAETFSDLQVLQKWQQNAPYKSLAVPIGLRGKEDLVYLNLHEKAHGPHGLIAGTTGSGKSETIQSYILSLAVNFHPHDVAFLLIDYKGGGMANLFKNLPHLLGTITNLDGAQSMRALASINAEIHRRERLFREFEVNHINQYQKKFKNGEATEPLPHLFLISDEFAELKVNQPDFIKELVSIARVGRSLGVHLILATQKPSGVVDDQIWSNSRFKLALKVADRTDSMEMLKTPDAAEITQTGRAYLQVGNNEVYELFQSAWSGADYQPDKDELGIEDHTIYLINDLGQYEVLNQDLSGLDLAEDIKEVPTELEAIVSQIQLLTESQQIPPVPQPWLPPLKERMTLDACDFKTVWEEQKSGLCFQLGLADMPHRQKQEIVTLDLTQTHIALYGGPGMGKTTFLQSMTLDLIRHYSPANLEVYLLDFGTNGLSPYRDFPHVADIFTLDDAEKINKLIKRLKDIHTKRKRLLSRTGVATIDLYQQLMKEQLPHVLVVLDNFEALKDEPYEDAMYKLLILLAREGIALGIHLVITSGRQLNIRVALHSNIKTQFTLMQNDYSDVTSVVGATKYRNMEDIRGRALLAQEEVNPVQLYLPFENENLLNMIRMITQEAGEMSRYWTGRLPESIPMAPAVLTIDDLRSRVGYQEAIAQAQIVLGLDKESVQIRTWNRTKTNLLMLSNKQEQMTHFMQYVLEQVDSSENKIVFAPELHDLDETDGVDILSDKISVEEMLEAVAYRITEKIKNKLYSKESFITFYGFATFVSSLSNKSIENLSFIIDKGRLVGYTCLIISDPSLASRIDAASKLVKQTEMLLLDMRIVDQNVTVPLNRNSREPLLDFQEQWVVEDKIAQKIQVSYIGELDE